MDNLAELNATHYNPEQINRGNEQLIVFILCCYKYQKRFLFAFYAYNSKVERRFIKQPSN